MDREAVETAARIGAQQVRDEYGVYLRRLERHIADQIPTRGWVAIVILAYGLGYLFGSIR